MLSISKENQSILLMIICSILWSTAGIFIKLIPWNPISIAGFRSFISLSIMYIYMKSQKIPFKFTKTSFISGISLAATFSFFVAANKFTTSANAIVLQSTAPVFILIISAVFLNKKFLKADIITVIITLLGIALFFLDQLSPNGILGNIFGVLAGLFVAIMYVSVGNSNDESTRMSGIFIGHIFTSLIGIPIFFITKQQPTTISIICILFLGIFQLGIPYILMAKAIKYCPALMCSLLGIIEPLLNPIWVFIFDGEAPGLFAVLGGIIVIITITIWCIWKEKNKIS